MHRHDLDALRAVAPHGELETMLAPSAREVRVRGRPRGRAVLVRFLTDAQRDPKRLVRLEASLATAVAMDPLYHGAWEDLAIAHLDCGDTAAAREAFLRARLARPACDRGPDLVAINAGAGAFPVGHRGPPPLDSLRACRLALTLTNLAEAKQHLEVALAREPGNRLFRRLADRLERRR